MRALIVGCGYTGTRLGARLVAEGIEVFGTTRSPARAAELETIGIRPLAGDLSDRDAVRRLDRVGPEVVFYLVPPVRSGPDPLLGAMTALARAPLTGFVYASSTSVYGDRGGAWVDETSAVQPVAGSGRDRHQAEREVLETGWRYQAPVRICRLAGIYGPGRTLRSSLERREYRLIRGHDTWTNRIHVDDLVSSLIAAWRAGTTGRIYNVVDDEPHRASTFSTLAAKLHGLPAPDWIELEDARAEYGEARLARKLEEKRVSNRRQREELGVDLRHPSYRTGLPAAVAEERKSSGAR